MTVDELAKLTNALLGGIELAHLRKGIDTLYIGDLPDDDYALLVRFLAGERPTVDVPVRSAARPPEIDPARDEMLRQVLKMDSDDGPSSSVRNVAKGRTDGGHLALGGEFDGIELP